MPEEVQVDNFATMAATLLGALEVIYSSMQAPSPEEAFVETKEGTLAIRSVTPRMFFVTLSKGTSEDLRGPVADAALHARSFLSRGT